MKKFMLIVTFAMVISLLCGCAGTPVVYYSNCTCPTGSHETNDTPATEAPVTLEGALKTGLAIVPGVSTSDADGAAGVDGAAEYSITLVGILVDENGVIADCVIDSIGTSVTFDAAGAITSDITAEILTKNELGDDYGMMAYSTAIAEWYQQADALAQYCIGKTIEEVQNGAIDETGYAADADLAASATIHLGEYVDGIVVAYNNARHLGAQAGDELRLASISSLASSAAGNAQLDVDAVALTVSGDVITSCYLDALQAKVAIDEAGVATVSNTLTKNELGYDYGMVAWAGAAYEWFEQAANFAAYVNGKTAAEVAGIAVIEGKPSDVDLAATVTIAIGGFQALIAKALNG